MIKIRAKLILAFIVTVLVCTVAALAVTYEGYNLVVAGIAASADGNNMRVADVRSMKDLMAAQQRLVVKSVVNLEAPDPKEFDQNGLELANLADELSRQSEDREISALKDLKNLNSQYADLFKSKIADAVKKSDTAEYERLFAEFGKQYNDLLSLELQLKKLIQQQVDVTVNAQQADFAGLGTLSAEQRASLDDLASALDKVLASYRAAAEDNAKLTTDNKALKAQIEGLQEELSLLKNSQAASAGGTATAQQSSQPLQEQSAATAYDKALEDTVRSYIEEALKSNTDSQTVLNRLETSALQGALTKAALIDTALDLTRDGYGKAMAEMAADGAGETGGFAAQMQGASDTLQQLGKLLTPKNAQTAADASSACGTLTKAFDALKSARDAVKNAGIAEGYSEADDLYGQQVQLLDSLEKSYKTYLANDIERSRSLKKQLMATLGGIALLSLLIGMLAALWLSRNILSPIRSMTRLLEKAGRGDLTDRVVNRRKDELGELGDKVNTVLDGQQKMLEQVKNTTGDIGTLRKALADLFAHSRENAGKVSAGIKNIMDNLVNGVKHPAASSGSADDNDGQDNLALSAGQAVEDGMRAIEIAASGERSVKEAEEVIRNVTDTVREIAGSIRELEDSSGRIGAITNTITEIASKTNLLALNAAIEAARAGQQGKGFTVLADEIRKLSEGSNKAAHEIKALITEIQGRIQFAVDRIGDGVSSVDEGVGKINEARDSILEITGTINNIVGTLKDTANAVRARQDNTAELIGTIDTISRAASETVASGEEIDEGLALQQKTMREMEEMTAKLDEVAGTLNGLLERFKV